MEKNEKKYDKEKKYFKTKIILKKNQSCFQAK